MLASGKPLTKRAGSGSVIQCTDPRIRLNMTWIHLENCFKPQELSKTYFSRCWYLYAEYGVDLPDEAEPDRLLGEARRKSVAVILLLHRLVQIKTFFLPDQYNRG